ncbi:MAG: hypothetical protein IPH87_11500 [Anaerolineae bacterium]|nr:hypothetical protein [Anaerolineae bacterium]
MRAFAATWTWRTRSQLRFGVRADGRITAASSSQISDGAAAARVPAQRPCKAPDLTPRFSASSNAGEVSGRTAHHAGWPHPAPRKILARAGLTIEDMDTIEISGAFASVVPSGMAASRSEPDPAPSIPHGRAPLPSVAPGRHRRRLMGPHAAPPRTHRRPPLACTMCILPPVRHALPPSSNARLSHRLAHPVPGPGDCASCHAVARQGPGHSFCSPCFGRAHKSLGGTGEAVIIATLQNFR